MTKSKPTIIIVGETHTDGLGDYVVQKMVERFEGKGKKCLIGIEYSENDMEKNRLKSNIGAQSRSFNDDKENTKGDLESIFEIAEVKKMPDGLDSNKYFTIENQDKLEAYHVARDSGSEEDRIVASNAREEAMVKNIKDRAEKGDADFIFVVCGANHVSGLESGLQDYHCDVSKIIPYRFSEEKMKQKDTLESIVEGIGDRDKKKRLSGYLNEEEEGLVFRAFSNPNLSLSLKLPESTFPNVSQMSDLDKEYYNAYKDDVKYFGATEDSIGIEINKVCTERKLDMPIALRNLSTEDLDSIKKCLSSKIVSDDNGREGREINNANNGLSAGRGL